MDYVKLAKKYAGNHSKAGSKEDALWVIALSLLSIAEREAAQQGVQSDVALCPVCQEPRPVVVMCEQCGTPLPATPLTQKL